MGYKAKGKWEALGHGACRRGYGQPERERSYKTSLFFSLAYAPPDPPTGVPASGIGYGQPERERSYKTSLFFSLAYAPPDPPTGVPASGIGYGFYHV